MFFRVKVGDWRIGVNIAFPGISGLPGVDNFGPAEITGRVGEKSFAHYRAKNPKEKMLYEFFHPVRKSKAKLI